MKNLEPHPVRIIGVLIVLGMIAVAILTPYGSGAIIGGGMLTAALVYDIGTALGQRRAFIEDVERRGYKGYADELRARKW